MSQRKTAISIAVTVVALVAIGALIWNANGPSRDAEVPPAPPSQGTTIVDPDVATAASQPERERPAGERAPIEVPGSTARVRSHGLLPDSLQQAFRQQMERHIASAARKLAKAQAQANLLDEGNALVWLERVKVQLQCLENGDYLLLDVGVASELWPTSPPGLTVVRVDTLTLHGKEVELVMVIETAKHPLLARAHEHREAAERKTAVQAAYEFNGASDPLRAAAIQLHRDGKTLQEVEDAELRHIYLALRIALGHPSQQLDAVRTVVTSR